MNEDKKTFLLELVRQLREELDAMATNMEDNYNIADPQWSMYDESIQGLHQIINGLEERIYFT